MSAGKLVPCVFLTLVSMYLVVQLPWPVPWEIADEKMDLYGVRYGFPLPIFETSLVSLDPPHPYPLYALGGPGGTDPLKIFWVNVVANVVVFFTSYLLLVSFLSKRFSVGNEN